jgi:hypothetical protein
LSLAVAGVGQETVAVAVLAATEVPYLVKTQVAVHPLNQR